MIEGIDVSDNNGAIDWPTVAKSIRLVMVKVNEHDYVSTALHEQRMGAHAAGVPWVGLYTFARPDLGDGRTAARLFCQAIGAGGGILPNEFLAVDIEQISGKLDPHADLRAWLRDLLEGLGEYAGMQVCVYSDAEQLRAFHLFDPPTPLADPNVWLWLVNLGSKTAPTVPVGRVLMVQHDWHGSVPGVPGEVDCDCFLGTDDDLRPLTWGNLPNPLAVKDTLPPPDLDPASADMPTILKHVYGLLADPATAPLARADLAAALVHYFGLIGV